MGVTLTLLVTHFVGPLIHQSIRPSVRSSIHLTLLFWRLCSFLPCCSCPNAPLTSNIALACNWGSRVSDLVYLTFETRLSYLDLLTLEWKIFCCSFLIGFRFLFD